MKAILRIGFLTVATLCMAVPNAHAVQVSYSLNEIGGAGSFADSQPTFLDQGIATDAGDYRFTGSVKPDRVGLIGVKTGFVADVHGVSVIGPPPLPCESEEDPCFGPDPTIETLWDRVQIETRAAATYETSAVVNTVDDFSGVGFLQFDWRITGTSSIQLGGQELSSNPVPNAVPGHFGVSGIEAATVATIGFIEESDVGSDSFPDAFLHAPAVGATQTNSLQSASLGLESILVPIDLNNPNNIVDVKFEFAVSTFLDVTNDGEFANILAIYDADFSNTATLESVTLFEEDEFGNLVVVNGASVLGVDGRSIVASTVPEPSAGILLLLGGCAGVIRRRRSCVA